MSKTTNKEACRRYRDRHPERRRESTRRSQLKRYYGITIEQYEQLLAEQQNVCAICGRSPEQSARRFHVDHDHRSGKVRGLLCLGCNVGLGGFRDDTKLLAKAIAYLKRNS